MSNQQLYLAIGIPSILVVLSWVTIFIQNNRLDSKFDGKIDKLDAKIDSKFDSLRTEMASELRAIRGDINTITKMYGEHGERLARLEEHK